MVFPDGYKFYDPIPNKSEASESEKHPTVSDSDKDAQRGVRVAETPAPAYEQEPRGTQVTLAKSRTKESMRPQRKAKPRPLDRFFSLVGRQSVFVKGFIVVALSCLPFLIFMAVAAALPPETAISTAYGNWSVDLVSRSLMVWWATFIILLGFGLGLSAVADYICTMSVTLEQFRDLARAICVRAVLVLWALAILTISPRTDPKESTDYIGDANKLLVLLFSLILVQGIILELIKIQYIEGFIGPRAARAAHELQVLKDLDHLTRPHRNLSDLGTFAWAIKKVFAPVQTTDFQIISNGNGNEDTWNRYAETVWDKISSGKTSLILMDICDQMDRVGRGDDKDKAAEVFSELDDSTDGQVTETEVKVLVKRVGIQLNRKTEAMTGIKDLSSKLEMFLSIVIILLLVAIYAVFFNETWGKKVASLWTGAAGISFAFAGPVSEFVSATVFCFGKHPYDVGDFVEIKDKKYIVMKIYLTNTQFEQVQKDSVRGLACVMSHASLQTEPIINWTRTLDEPYQRHADSAASDSSTKSSREVEVANLVSAKLNYLQKAEAAKTSSQ